jgi:hypothetical protein
VFVEGHGGHLRGPARSAIRGWRGWLSATHPGRLTGRSRGRAKAVVGAVVERAALGLTTPSRVSSTDESAGCHRAVSRPSRDLQTRSTRCLRKAVRRPVTVVLGRAARRVDCETCAWRKSGGVPDRESGPRSPRSSICRRRRFVSPGRDSSLRIPCGALPSQISRETRSVAATARRTASGKFVRPTALRDR